MHNSSFLLGLLEKNPAYISPSFYQGMATPGSVQRHRLKISDLRGTPWSYLLYSSAHSRSHGKIPAHLQLQSELNGFGKQINKQSSRASGMRSLVARSSVITSTCRILKTVSIFPSYPHGKMGGRCKTSSCSKVLCGCWELVLWDNAPWTEEANSMQDIFLCAIHYPVSNKKFGSTLRYLNLGLHISPRHHWS